jgi:hypothetical protein
MHEEIWSDLACPIVLAHTTFGNECSFGAVPSVWFSLTKMLMLVEEETRKSLPNL